MNRNRPGFDNREMEPLNVDDGAVVNPRFTEEERARIARARQQSNVVVITRPKALGYFSIAFIIVNRMVGTGIFRTPTTVMQGTDSVGYTLVFWVIGAIVSMAGVLVYTEFGLTVPRLKIEGQEVKESVPRNGGEKNYLEYMCKWPRYLATCVYGIPFICLGNVSGNCILFAESIIEACGKVPTNGATRALAIGVATFACLVHAVWRRGGIYLNNAFGFVKIAMLIMLFVVGIASAAGAFKGNQFEKPAEVAKENFDVHNAFSGASTESYGYAEAFLAILFAFGGFNQANYVLGDIDDPRRKFKPTAIFTVGFVSVMYILINIAYMLVVPKHLQYQKGGDTVVSHYFQGIFGKKSANQVLDAIIAFSSLGNIIVQTFTAARVKQEIAKEGILPFSKFFAKNTSFRRSRNMAPDVPETSEDTPVGALLLHWMSALMLILGSIPLVPNDAYKTFVKLYSFTIDALFGFCVGLSLLVLRLNKSSRWSSKSDVNPIVSISAALVFTIANLFPLVAIWIPDPGTSFITPSVSWFVTGTVGMGLILLGLFYWFVLYYVLPWIWGMRLEVEKEEVLDDGYGYWVMWHEIVRFNWVIL